MITFEGLEKEYRTKDKTFKALNGINLTIEKGEIFGVIGFSGAGKSTLIRCVNFLEKPTGGRVLVDGQDLLTLTPANIRKVKRNIGMVFQHFNLLQSKTVFANIAMPLVLEGAPKKQIKQRVEELLKFVGLSDKAGAYPEQLSGGQKQRVGIARALATQPSILLCDEATSALDPQTTGSILKLLKKINAEYKITILMITHEMSVIRDVCDKVAVIEGGEIIESGTVFDIFSNPQTKTAQNFVHSVLNDSIPESVRNLVQEHNPNGKLFKINFVGASSGQPLLSKIAKKFDVDINVLFGNITELQGVPFGHLIVELRGQENEIKRAYLHIQQENVSIREVIADAS
ncbi:methionine ABC transporter ATP-binding protein [Peribacillus psychrosaccharolyticus]|uniref:Methionine ABC transporter ATP-binding protein n=1 Tax=Peribacillus psychrosaccharolyticus TaxID=1407 RepID=A0A974NJ55_PERPY|nr:methionine ABC transporter ATP-binding protein [Peribacillus psychrosaccharolyticus]MEC2057830.1 methionine ABC transporter ATP-binding protein [Peribacillus psychrosaccharolyticus]MED3744521.1 methionine ABC transporter ATP-binding protein [Peribacillus psychrosaccharolyticus]QQS98649.1 methionine ABC transporter ATP-binding protein [Peribacillus psychrosaccharolyticus]